MSSKLTRRQAEVMRLLRGGDVLSRDIYGVFRFGSSGNAVSGNTLVALVAENLIRTNEIHTAGHPSDIRIVAADAK